MALEGSRGHSLPILSPFISRLCWILQPGSNPEDDDCRSKVTDAGRRRMAVVSRRCLTAWFRSVFAPAFRVWQLCRRLECRCLLRESTPGVKVHVGLAEPGQASITTVYSGGPPVWQPSIDKHPPTVAAVHPPVRSKHHLRVLLNTGVH